MNLVNISKFAIGPIGSGILGLGVVPLTAWLFSPEDIGRFSIFQLCISFGLLVFALGLDSAYVREFHGTKDQAVLFKGCFLPGFGVMLIVIFIGIIYTHEISNFLFRLNNPYATPLIAASLCLAYLSRFMSLILRMQERGIAYSMGELIPRIIQFLALLALFLFEINRSLSTLLWIYTISMLIVVILYAYLTREQWSLVLTAKVSTELQKTLFSYGTPLVFSGLVYWALTASSVLFLRNESTLDELGIYSVTSSIAAVAAIFQSIFSVVWAPTVYKWINEGVDSSQFDRITYQALGVIGVLVCVIGSLTWILDYILPDHYQSVKYILVCAVMPTLLYALSEITSIGIGVTRRTTLTIWVASSAFCTNLIACYLLIPAHGAAGAVVANVIAYLVFFVARTELSAKVWRQFPRIKVYFVLSFIVSLAIGTVLIGPLLFFSHSIVYIIAMPTMYLLFFKDLSALAAIRNK